MLRFREKSDAGGSVGGRSGVRAWWVPHQGGTGEGTGRVRSKDDAYCTSIGAQPNTPTYTQCRLTLRQQLLNQQADTRASLNAAAEGLAQAGKDISNNQARIDAANASRNINCTATQFGSQINTSCY